MSCCHYDEGYEEGREEALRERGADTIRVFLEAVARNYDAHLEWEKADLVRQIVAETAAWNIERLLELEQVRVVGLARAYTESRAA